MNIKEKLLEGFSCAITAILGDVADEEYELDKVNKEDLLAMAKKVAWYLE